MKLIMPLLIAGSLIVVLQGCGSTLATAHNSLQRQTIQFTGASVPTTSYTDEENDVALPLLSQNASLQQCLIFASLNSPALRSAFHQWQASLSRIPQVSAHSDPRISFGYFIEEIQTRTGPMEQQLSLTQSFPWWGLLEAKGDVAAMKAKKMWLSYESIRLELYEKVVHRWTALVDLHAEIEVVHDSFELLAEAERIARRSYEVDNTSHDKLVSLQVELGKLEDKLIRLRDLVQPRVAGLNALLARDSFAPLKLPNSIALHLYSFSLSDAYTFLEQNPALLSIDASIEQHSHNLRVAELDAKPKWTVGMTYTNLGDPLDPTTPDAGNNPVMGMVGFSIPLNSDKYDAAKQEAISNRMAAIATKESLFHTLKAEIAEALYQRDDSVRRIEFYETALIPRAEDSLSAALSSFSAGKSSVISLLDAQRTLLELQRNVQGSYVSAKNADATISKLIGGSTMSERSQ